MIDYIQVGIDMGFKPLLKIQNYVRPPYQYNFPLLRIHLSLRSCPTINKEPPFAVAIEWDHRRKL